MVSQVEIRGLDRRPQQITQLSNGWKTFNYYLPAGLGVFKVSPLNASRLRPIGRTPFTDVFAERMNAEYNALAADRLVIVNNTGLNAEVRLTINKTRPVEVIVPSHQTLEWLVPFDSVAVDTRLNFEWEKDMTRQRAIDAMSRD